jgi:hypothetical protein
LLKILFVFDKAKLSGEAGKNLTHFSGILAQNYVRLNYKKLKIVLIDQFFNLRTGQLMKENYAGV